MWPEFLIRLLVIAAVQDARMRKISNWISLAVFLMGFVKSDIVKVVIRSI
jgi:Flp pilus assembly protein protease CpaA